MPDDSEAIQSVSFSKGAFPARYGGRLSSVMDVRTREGNQKEWSGSLKAGLVSSSARIEGPIIKNKASLLITARRTLLDKFIQNKTAKSKAEDQYFIDLYGVPLQGFSNYNFYDLNGKLNFSLGKKDKFYFSYYNGGDNFLGKDFISVNKDQSIDWEDIKHIAISLINEFYQSGNKFVIDKDIYEIKTEENLLEVEKQIIKILDTKIKPAVAKDGGDIKFKEFKNGVVTVQLQGSCSGCPSSTMTLKQGVQNLLCHYLSEVKEVVAI